MKLKEPENKSCDWHLLNDAFSYDPDTGKLTWKYSPRYGIKPGDEAGYIRHDHNGDLHYRSTYLNKKLYNVHRIAWCLVYGCMPVEIDHLDGDGTNNRLPNLREVSNSVNQQNKTKQRNNTSGVQGVHYDKSKNMWTAKINVFKVRVFLGSFYSFDEAVAARKDAEIHYEFHPNHGRDRITPQ